MASSKRPLSSSRGGGTAHSSRRRNKFLALIDGGMSEEMSESNARDELHYHATAHSGGSGNHLVDPAARELKLPTGPVLYNPNVWISDEMRAIRARFSDGIFFQQFNSGLQAFYAKDWVSYLLDHGLGPMVYSLFFSWQETSLANFRSILDRFEDGPSRYFYTQIWNSETETLRKPPRKFRGYGVASR